MKWATRSGIHIDRAARAWLIRRQPCVVAAAGILGILLH